MLQPYYELVSIPATPLEPGAPACDPTWRIIVSANMEPDQILDVAEHPDIEILQDWVRDTHPEAKSRKTLNELKGGSMKIQPGTAYYLCMSAIQQMTAIYSNMRFYRKILSDEDRADYQSQLDILSKMINRWKEHIPTDPEDYDFRFRAFIDHSFIQACSV